MRQDAMKLIYEKAELLGYPVLFSDLRIRRDTVPEGLTLYEVRHSEEDWGVPCQIRRGILVNFYGSILTSDPIQLSPDDQLLIGPDDLEYTGTSHVSMEAYLAEHPPTERDIMELTILEQDKWPLLFSRSGAEDRKNRCIGHLRGDFGSGDAFHSSWNPHQNGALDTPEFRADLKRVVEWLQQEYAPLRNLQAMGIFCGWNKDARVKAEPGEVYGFRVETARYRYMLRCTPTKGVYHCYVYCYQKRTDGG